MRLRKSGVKITQHTHTHRQTTNMTYTLVHKSYPVLFRLDDNDKILISWFVRVAQWQGSRAYSKVYRPEGVCVPRDSKPNIMIDTKCQMFVKIGTDNMPENTFLNLLQSAILTWRMGRKKKLGAFSLENLKLKSSHETLWTRNIFSCFNVLAIVHVQLHLSPLRYFKTIQIFLSKNYLTF